MPPKSSIKLEVAIALVKDSKSSEPDGAPNAALKAAMNV